MYILENEMITVFLICTNMYIIVHSDVPDTIIWNHSEMYNILVSLPSRVAFEYTQMMNGRWKIARKFMIVDNELLHYESGTWLCPSHYLTYTTPNVCSVCEYACFMQGSHCTNCITVCIECIGPCTCPD